MQAMLFDVELNGGNLHYLMAVRVGVNSAQFLATAVARKEDSGRSRSNILPLDTEGGYDQDGPVVPLAFCPLASFSFASGALGGLKSVDCGSSLSGDRFSLSVAGSQLVILSDVALVDLSSSLTAPLAF